MTVSTEGGSGTDADWRVWVSSLLLCHFLASLLKQISHPLFLFFKHQWQGRKYYIEGNFITSHVEGSEESIERTQKSLTHLFNRVDADHVSVDATRTSLTGTGGKVEFGKASTGHWRYNAGTTWKSPELELNDIGFLRQADEIRGYAGINYSSLKPFGKFRSININADAFATFDFEGNYNRIQYRLTSAAEFKNNWWSEIGFIHKPRIFTNTILRGGPRFRFSEENINFFFFGTDRSKKLRVSTGYVYSFAAQNNFTFFEVETDITYQPTNAFSISFNPEFSINPNKTQYVTETSVNNSPRYILGSIKQQTLSASLRLNYTINPNLTIQYYGQPFISRGTYSQFKFINYQDPTINPIADDLNNRFRALDGVNQVIYDASSDRYAIDEDLNGVADYEINNPDFSFVQFRSNLVVRWEYIPGSEVFLVWSQGITGSGNVSEDLFRNLDNQILGQEKENTFLIKATYRFRL